MTGGWLAAVAAVFLAIGGGSGIASLVLVHRQGRKLKADASEVLTKAAVTMVEPLERRLADSERRLAESEGRVELLQTALDEALADAHRVRRLYQRIQRAVMDPAATIDWVRELVGQEPIV